MVYVGVYKLYPVEGYYRRMKMIALSWISHQGAKRGCGGDGGSAKANASQGAQAYLPVFSSTLAVFNADDAVGSASAAGAGETSELNDA